MLKSRYSDFVEQAVEEAKLAYQFSPSSYTFGALHSILSLRLMSGPDWMQEYEAYHAHETELALN